MMESFATAYRLVFFDGEKEHDKGNIGIHSMTNYKKLQALLSQKTGLPPSRQSIAFVCWRSQNSNNEKRQKLPVNEKTNFSKMLNQHNPNRGKDCYFCVAIKKPKKGRKVGSAKAGSFPSSGKRIGSNEYMRTDKYPSAKLPGKSFRRVKQAKSVLCQSGQAASCLMDSVLVNLGVDDWHNNYFPEELSVNDWIPSFYGNALANEYGQSFYPSNTYDGMFEDGASGNLPVPQDQSFAVTPYQGQGEGYFASNVFDEDMNGSFMKSPSVLCEQCRLSKGRPVQFHFCVYDTVVAGFRGPSPLGPIERPVKAAS